MTRPTVTEITQELEPVTHDSFIDVPPERDAQTPADDQRDADDD